ncbi:ATP-binding cassette domain-containing protein [Acidipila sp. EB88]|nr:ATP-binding cassette domain-containing protein [Acidipila sp. EB88]
MHNVSVARGDAMVLHALSLQIRLGEHIALLGPNGCGKSTLIKTLTREQYPMVPLPGEPPMHLRLMGKERWDLSQLRSSFGVVSADLPGERTPHTPGLDAVIAGFFGASALWPNHVVTDAMETRAREALELMRATHLSSKLVGAMSAGEQRRVMIARALVHRPAMLLLDEPSNALDLRAQHELRLAMRSVAQTGTGLILVTHQLGDIIPEIERVVLMRAGRILADGTRAELLQEQVLTDLFEVELRLTERDGFVHAW